MSEFSMTLGSAAAHEAAGVHDDGRRHKLGLLYVWATPLAMCSRLAINVDFGGFHVGGWVWVALLLVGIYLLFAGDAKEFSVRQPCRPWLIWGGIYWTSALWREGLDFNGVQLAIQITMPILVAAVSSRFVRTEKDLRRLMSMFLWSLAPIAVGICLINSGAISDEDQVKRSLALSLALIGCVFLAQKPWWSYVGWIACLGLILVSASRMAAVAAVGVMLLHPEFRGRRRLFAAGIVLVCGLAVFYSPIFQERTFRGGVGAIRDLGDSDDVDTAGRSDAWPLIYAEAWNRPVLGHGMGAVREYTNKVWPGMWHPHNDYLRVGFDCGLLGLAIYLAVSFWQLFDMHRAIGASSGTVRQAFVGAYLGFLVLMITSLSDNTLVYNISFTDPLFALLGGAYGSLNLSSESRTS